MIEDVDPLICIPSYLSSFVNNIYLLSIRMAYHHGAASDTTSIIPLGVRLRNTVSKWDLCVRLGPQLIS